MFSYFDFDNHFVNMYRAGQFFARLDCNKFSLTKLNAEYLDFKDNV